MQVIVVRILPLVFELPRKPCWDSQEFLTKMKMKFFSSLEIVMPEDFNNQLFKAKIC